MFHSADKSRMTKDYTRHMKGAQIKDGEHLRYILLGEKETCRVKIGQFWKTQGQ